MAKRMLFVLTMLLSAIFILPAMAADESDMVALAATWAKEYNAGNLAAVADLYSKDGCRMPPNVEKSCGTDGIVAQLKNSKGMGAANIKVGVTASETSGNVGYGMGTFEITGADGAHLDHGKWMNITKKIDGKWQIIADIWNSDMPMPATAK